MLGVIEMNTYAKVKNQMNHNKLFLHAHTKMSTKTYATLLDKYDVCFQLDTVIFALLPEQKLHFNMYSISLFHPAN